MHFLAIEAREKGGANHEQAVGVRGAEASTDRFQAGQGFGFVAAKPRASGLKGA